MGSNPTVICLKTLQWLWAEHLGGIHLEVGAKTPVVSRTSFFWVERKR